MTDSVPLIVEQDPNAGAPVTGAGEPVSVALSLGANPTGFNWQDTVISQYANSPTLNRLIQNFNDYIDPAANLTAFYNYVWNVDTAQGFGLDYWGRIVGVGRLLQLPAVPTTFGFDTGDNSFLPFNQAPFFGGDTATQTFSLPDDPYRLLVLLKAFSNICETTIPVLNSMLNQLFAGRGRCYVQDYGNMAMAYAFEFPLTPVEYAILTQTGVPPHPAGVQVSILQIDLANTFGFDGSGLLPFNQAPFYSGT